MQSCIRFFAFQAWKEHQNQDKKLRWCRSQLCANSLLFSLLSPCSKDDSKKEIKGQIDGRRNRKGGDVYTCGAALVCVT